MADIFMAPMDFKGQHLAEQIAQYTLLAFAGVGLVVGFIQQQLLLTFKIYGIGCLLTCLVCIPSWKIYRDTPVKWARPKSVPLSKQLAGKDKKATDHNQ